MDGITRPMGHFQDGSLDFSNKKVDSLQWVGPF